MQLEVYSICFNEGALLPFYLNHYKKFCERIIVYDNDSTDNTLEILQSEPKVEIRKLNTNNELNDFQMMDVWNSCWVDSKADYVICAAIDEFVQLQSKMDSLETHHDVLKCEGYNMYSEKFPKIQAEFDSIADGIYSEFYSKPIIFKPSVGPHLSIGNHESSLPVFQSDIKLLHYHYLSLEYILQRNSLYSKRMSQANLLTGAGSQRLNNNKTIEQFKFIQENKTRVK